MSSFIGHGLAALGVYTVEPPLQSRRASFLWLCWLVILSWSPDIDYLLTSLRIDGARLTHSIAFCLILPTLTALALHAMRASSRPHLIVQAYATNLSHLVLDLLVGVTPLPLLWPLIWATFRLPFGILPSAGHIAFGNVFLYLNALIEIGVLLPLVICIYLIRRKSPLAWFAPLITISICFAAWAFTLSR